MSKYPTRAWADRETVYDILLVCAEVAQWLTWQTVSCCMVRVNRDVNSKSDDFTFPRSNFCRGGREREESTAGKNRISLFADLEDITGGDDRVRIDDLDVGLTEHLLLHTTHLETIDVLPVLHPGLPLPFVTHGNKTQATAVGIDWGRNLESRKENEEHEGSHTVPWLLEPLVPCKQNSIQHGLKQQEVALGHSEQGLLERCSARKKGMHTIHSEIMTSTCQRK